jgi:hypothetical protein
MNMKKAIITLVFLLLIAAGNGQITRYDTVTKQKIAGFQPGKFDYGLSLGSQFSTTAGYGSALTSYVAPTISYNLSKRFRIGGGITYINTNLFNTRSWYNTEETQGISGNYSTGIVHINGTYLVSNKLTLSGSAFKAFPISAEPLPYNPYNPISSKGAQGVNFNVDYKITENFHIQAGFGYSSGVNPLYSNSYYQNPFQQGFGPGFGFGAPNRW